MGGGGALRGNLGNWLSRFSANFGVGSPILAELLAMEQDVALESECLEVIQIVSDQIPIIIAPILTVVNNIISWLTLPWVVTVSFVFREANMVADFMAQNGSHSPNELKLWEFPLPACHSLVLLDLTISV
ncbi:unnamed protein product [Lupinus luteus]|uniref:RNase H type-1 domain-containing protein n=1 Tax=Lupinus luteus TaxID=3873 RepID=A0AAV1VR46_LUPLU